MENETFEKMKACVETKFGENSVRCPSLSKMAEVVNLLSKGRFTATITKTTRYKGRQMSNGVYYDGGEYSGNAFDLFDSTGKLVFSHDSTETYRTNREVAEYLLRNVFRGSD